MKKITLFILISMLTGCSYELQEKYACPEIVIPRATTRSYQNEITDKFQINLVGHETYCYQEDADNRYYAVISPIFKVRRLEHSNTTSVDANYYVKTSINDKDYIGKRSFYQTLNIPLNTKEIRIKGSPSINRISTPPYNNFKIYIGMDLNKDRKEKAKKMFDIDYRYLSKEEIDAQNEETINLEILPDEEIVFSEKLQKPVVVKKNRPKNDCQN